MVVGVDRTAYQKWYLHVVMTEIFFMAMEATSVIGFPRSLCRKTDGFARRRK